MSHPSHEDQLSNLKRIEGQVRGIQRLIEEGTYCIDILNQVKAIRKSISTVEGKILEKHLRSCLKETLTNSHQFDNKVEEIMRVIKR
tara:strand:+ start:241 stop:501 length:261 start_codon:yes stop_codon:yes gene_type:complete